MIKYAKIINDETGKVIVGIGINVSFYQKIGMQPLDVSQSDIDGQWYLTEKCPMKTKDEKLREAKQIKSQEALNKANDYINNGEALFSQNGSWHIEATDGNIGKFSAYAWAFQTNKLKETDTVTWVTKEDKTVELSQADISSILTGLIEVQAEVWSEKYAGYLEAIEKQKTVQKVEALEIDYSK